MSRRKGMEDVALGIEVELVFNDSYPLACRP
jgi:hypothetical protein